MSDPVASKSSFLCMYMSNHPDTLVSYVKYWGKVKDSGVTSAQMKSIDTKGMTLTYKTKSSGDAKNEVRVEFDPPLTGYEEVKPRLMNMKAEAEEALGMMKAPQLSTFHLNPKVIQTGAMISFLIYTTFAPTPTSPSYASVYFLANLIRESLPNGILKPIWIMMIVMHVLEALYTFTLCRKHSTGFGVGTLYVFFTFLFGYPIFTDIRRRMQTARIESIMKGQ